MGAEKAALPREIIRRSYPYEGDSFTLFKMAACCSNTTPLAITASECRHRKGGIRKLASFPKELNFRAFSKFLPSAREKSGSDGCYERIDHFSQLRQNIRAWHLDKTLHSSFGVRKKKEKLFGPTVSTVFDLYIKNRRIYFFGLN